MPNPPQRSTRSSRSCPHLPPHTSPVTLPPRLCTPPPPIAPLVGSSPAFLLHWKLIHLRLALLAEHQPRPALPDPTAPAMPAILQLHSHPHDGCYGYDDCACTSCERVKTICVTASTPRDLLALSSRLEVHSSGLSAACSPLIAKRRKPAADSSDRRCNQRQVSFFLR